MPSTEMQKLDVYLNVVARVCVLRMSWSAVMLR